jgi:type II secretory pathway predicted ATPase ExeA
VQQLAGEGGFALLTGVPGCGKSATLRILSASLATQRDVTVGVISRPQANIADFYREMGELFGVELRPHNRYGGAKTLRQRWQAHIQSTLSRPVLVVDEAQEMQSGVHAELRLLASADLDSHILLTIVLAGDGRLAERLHSDDLLPLASRGHTMRLPTSASRTPYRPGEAEVGSTSISVIADPSNSVIVLTNTGVAPWKILSCRPTRMPDRSWSWLMMSAWRVTD